MSDRDYSKIGQPTFQKDVDASLDVDELHMRETLGLAGRGRSSNRPQANAAPKQRHRFVQDGEVPVIHLSGQRDGDTTASFRARIAALEAECNAEHAARLKAEQAAQAALGQLHALETKLAHLEMSTRETVASERRLREQVEAELQSAILARDAARQEPAPAKERAKPLPRAPKQKGASREKEPQPVKWWLGLGKVKAAPRTS